MHYCTQWSVYTPLIGAGFARIFVLSNVGFCSAKAVTITYGVYTMLCLVVLSLFKKSWHL